MSTSPNKETADSILVPKYRILADELRRQIQCGELQPGQPLPSYLEIKKLHGVSKSTVEKTYQELEAQQLIERRPGSGVYVREPNTRRATGLIGFVDASPSFNRQFQHYIQFVDGLRAQANAQNQCLVLIDDPVHFTRWHELDGLVLSEQDFSHYAPEHSWDDLRQFIPSSLPLVNTFFTLPGAASVVVDEADGIGQLIGHLAAQGHRRIGYLGRMHQSQFASHPQVQLRYQAYLESLQQHGLEIDPALVYSPPLEHFRDYPAYGYNGMQLWLQNGWRDLGCTAILGHNDRAATGMIDALQQAGLKVPVDVSVAGFDGTETFQLAAYGLTTVRVPVHEIGVEALKLLTARSLASFMMPVELVAGKTTAEPRQTIAIAA